MAAANSNNAKRSTGPRTKRGKRATRFNAVKFGLFSEEVVIPLCDGDEALDKYRSLLGGFRQQFEPVGATESCFVEIIADSFWGLRRAKRAERGSSVVNLWDASPFQKESLMQKLVESLVVKQRLVSTLNAAREEIHRTGTLSEATYAKVSPLVGSQQQAAVKTPEMEKAKESKPTIEVKTPEADNARDSKPTIDDDFIRRLEEKQVLLERDVILLSTQFQEMVENLVAKSSLPPAEEMDKIFRYENRKRKQFDWAWQKLSECQKRRKKR
jgi:hypothetical protein